MTSKRCRRQILRVFNGPISSPRFGNLHPSSKFSSSPPLKFDDGSTTEGGEVLIQNTWNAEIYEPLKRIVEPHDMHVWKNRLSAFWGGIDAERILSERVIRTLIFAGCNTDQCVSASLTDAGQKGWDCLLLSDGTATTSPKFAQETVEFNMIGWGFQLACADVAEGMLKQEAE